MTRHRLILLVAGLLVLSGCTVHASQLTAKGGGNSKGGGKPVTVLETLPPDTTDPATTTTVFDPGGPVTGSIALGPSDLRWGGYVTFDSTWEGTLATGGQVQEKVVCLGTTAPTDLRPYSEYTVVYQAADLGSFADGVFPLVDLSGLLALGIEIDVSQPGACTAELEYRYYSGRTPVLQTLDSLTFTVAPA